MNKNPRWVKEDEDRETPAVWYLYCDPHDLRAVVYIHGTRVAFTVWPEHSFTPTMSHVKCKSIKAAKIAAELLL